MPLLRLLILLVAFGPTLSAEAAESVDFFPLSPGITWSYTNVATVLLTETIQPGSFSVRGIPTSKILLSGGPENGSEAFFTNDPSGVRLHLAVVAGPDSGQLQFTTPW